MTVLALHLFSSPCQAKDGSLENQLIKALKIKPDGQKRQAKSRPVILAYKRAGILPHYRDRRIDYMDFYLVRKPASFMGHKLVLLEEEYFDKWVGCCVSPGLGVAIAIQGDTTELEEFAENNACRFTPHYDLHERLIKDYGVRSKLAKHDYGYLSCRERDARKDD